MDHFFSDCTQLRFGDVAISEEEASFGHDLNKEIMRLCQSLPPSTHTDACLFFMQHFKPSFNHGIDFLDYFYIPSWSILYWLSQNPVSSRINAENVLEDAMRTHIMTMLLHALDDHLKDQDLPVTHLALLIRSQAWSRMNESADRLAQTIENGHAIVSNLLDTYYRGIRNNNNIETLDEYCSLFQQQMATSLIAPMVLCKKLSPNASFSEAVVSAYGSFGVAWRLLDDLQDLETDFSKGVPSAVYICLPEESRKAWGHTSNKEQDTIGDLLETIQKNRLIPKITHRICNELETAARLADQQKMPGLASEFRSLMVPLKNTR